MAHGSYHGYTDRSPQTANLLRVSRGDGCAAYLGIGHLHRGEGAINRRLRRAERHAGKNGGMYGGKRGGGRGGKEWQRPSVADRVDTMLQFGYRRPPHLSR